MNTNHDNELLKYKVGALLYAPATNTTVSKKLLEGNIQQVSSMAFCLEDAILDSSLPLAEKQLVATLSDLQSADKENLPLLFVRVRNPQHLAHVHQLLGELENVLTGYIFPKFDSNNANEFIDVFGSIVQKRQNHLFAMPTIESESVSYVEARREILSDLSSIMRPFKDYVLNVRVGGNDLCSQFGLRRNVDQTIYDIGVVRNALVDVVSFFANDYVISGPVWEYYGERGGAWEDGLRAEMRLDLLNGFIGKTAIHPSQIPVIQDMLKVSKADYEDALAVSNWSTSDNAVAAGLDGHRMNELKCHSNWANRIISLAKVYGVREGA